MLFLSTLCYADGSRRANESAEVTANAFGTYEAWLSGVMVKDDCLVTTIVAGNLTSATTDTESLVELRIDDGVTVQMVWLQELW